MEHALDLMVPASKNLKVLRGALQAPPPHPWGGPSGPPSGPPSDFAPIVTPQGDCRGTLMWLQGKGGGGLPTQSNFWMQGPLSQVHALY